MTLTAFQIVDIVRRMSNSPVEDKSFSRCLKSKEDYLVAIDEALAAGVKEDMFANVGGKLSFHLNNWTFERGVDRWVGRGPRLPNSEAFPSNFQIFADIATMRKFLEVLRSTDFYRPETVGKPASLFSL